MADTLGRLLASHLTQTMGQQFYVENRGGAGNIIGIDLVAKSPPDGYTILVCAGTITINHIMYKKLPYDVLRDLAPITQLVSLPNVLVVHPSRRSRRSPTSSRRPMRSPARSTTRRPASAATCICRWSS